MYKEISLINILNEIGYSFVELTQDLGEVSFWIAEDDNEEVVELLLTLGNELYYRYNEEKEWKYNCNVKQFF